MRTTLTLDNDILAAARALSKSRGVSIGAAVSELARRGLAPASDATLRNGIRLLPAREGAGTANLEIVKALLGETD